MKVISLGSWASYGLKGKKHFSLILEHRGKRAWIDPAVKYTEPVDFILLSSPDEDHWRYLPKYLEKYPDTPIYSTRAVISHMRLLLPKANWKRTEKPIKLGGKSIKLTAIPKMVGKPAVAFKIGSGRNALVIIPEFIRLGDQEKELMKGAIWIIGVGEYEKPRSDDHKATFKDLLALAEELKPQKIYITNYRTSLLKHKQEILEALKPWKGEFLNDGDEFEIKVKAIRKADGLYLVKPHAEFIYKGLKTMILKSRKFDMANKKYVLCDNEYAYGNIILDEPIIIRSWKEFYLHAKEHLISPAEVRKWNWNFPLYAYPIKSFSPFSKKKALKLPKGIQTFVNDIEQYYITEKLHLDEFRSEGVDYDLAHPKERWKELIADLRYLGNSAYPRLKAGKKWGDWKLTDVLKYFAKIVDTLRSIYFPLIPPFDEKLYKAYYGKDPKKAKESSFWKCYKEAEKYMKSKPPKTIEEAKEWDEKRKGVIKKAKIKPGYYSKSKPYYRGYFQELAEELKSIGWDKTKVLVDCKWDGLRMTIGKVNGKGFAYVDPEDVKKKSPNVSNRIPAIIKEIEENFPDNTVLDSEFLALHPNGKEMLHRTVANSLLNSKISGEELEQFAIIVVFDVIFFKGLDVRDQPLHERLEYLSQLKPTKHIWIERVSKTLSKKADGYICDGSDVKTILKVAEILEESKNGRPKFCAEGIMIKRLDHPYETPQNKGWMKVKFYHELDLRVLGKKLVKGTKDVYNYYLGYDTPRDYAKAYLDVGKKAWYGKVHVYKNGKILAVGKDAKNYLDDKSVTFVTLMGKSDNHKEEEPVKVGDIIRIAAEEVLKFDNPKHPEYPRYSFYIGRVLEPVPEKNVTDSIETIDKLSSFEPMRIPVDVLRHWKEHPEELKRGVLKSNGHYFFPVDDDYDMKRKAESKDDKILVVDTNLGLEHARRFGLDGYETFFAIAHSQPYPRIQDEVCGLGFPEIIKIWDWGEGLEKDASYVIFTDSGFGHLAEWLRSKGYYVIGGDGTSERLELDRAYVRKIFEQLNIPVPPGKIVKGVQGVIDAVKAAKEKVFVKISRVRGDVETFGTDDPDEAAMLLSRGAFQVLGDDVSFIVEEKLNGIEIGVDAWFNGREFNEVVADTIEMKGCGNATKFNTIHESIWRDILEKLEPWLRKNGYVGMFCLEGFWDGSKVYVTDVTPRFPYICSYAYPKVFKNYSEFMLGVARGDTLTPKALDKYSVQIGVYTDDAETWRIIRYNRDDTDWIAYRRAIKQDDNIWFVPGDVVVAAGIGIGPDITTATRDAIARAEAFDMANIYSQGREFASYLHAVLEQASALGYDF